MVLKTEGNTYATLLHHPFLFRENQRSAQEVADVPEGTLVLLSQLVVRCPVLLVWCTNFELLNLRAKELQLEVEGTTVL